MHKSAVFLFLLLLPAWLFSQTSDQSEWINFGGGHMAQWLQIAPGKMGPNALLVPRMDYARVGYESKLELGVHYHQMTGDTAINSFFRYYWNIAPGRAAVEIWGQPGETFRSTNEVRDFRQVVYRDEGWMTVAGDLLISTYIQLLKDKTYLPDMVLNYSLKTTTGDNYHARYTNAGMNYFYMAFGKSLFTSSKWLSEIRIAGLTGFYVWQTNKVEMAQDEGAVIELGIELKNQWLSLYTEYGGYNGYDAYKYMNGIYGEGAIQGHNDPRILRTRIKKTGKIFNITAEYQTGFQDYHYQTFRLAVIYHFKAPERKW